jgi:hypothetical protein
LEDVHGGAVQATAPCPQYARRSGRNAGARAQHNRAWHGDRSMRPLHLASLLALLGGGAVAQPADELRNWFDDPFFQVRSAIADCPLPAGPFVTEQERRAQSHRRAEKGTTAWLAGEAQRPQAYAYDREIAAALREAFADGRHFPDTALWLTVQGRVVYVEGCSDRADDATRLEAYVRALPQVQQAIAIIRTDASAPPPYRVLPKR